MLHGTLPRQRHGGSTGLRHNERATAPSAQTTARALHRPVRTLLGGETSPAAFVLCSLPDRDHRSWIRQNSGDSGSFILNSGESSYGSSALSFLFLHGAALGNFSQSLAPLVGFVFLAPAVVQLDKPMGRLVQQSRSGVRRDVFRASLNAIVALAQQRLRLSVFLLSDQTPSKQ